MPELPKSASKVLVLGAAGGFGRRILRSLAVTTDLPLIAMGRHAATLEALALEVGSARVRVEVCDATSINAKYLRALAPAVVIDTVGPFQWRDKSLATLCISLGIHYIDLADDRRYVAQIDTLNASARAAGVLVVSGASTVPALSSAVVDELKAGITGNFTLDIGISPGFRGPRGIATIRSVLSYVGRPIPVWRAGSMRESIGWSERRTYRYPPPVGARDLSLVDVPDVALFPQRYAGLSGLDVRAGLEVSFVHRSLGLLGWLVRAGALQNLQPLAPWLKRAANVFDRFGSDRGAMHVSLLGTDSVKGPVRRTWTLVAGRGDGPEIPGTAAALLTRKLLGRENDRPLSTRGAMPCVGLITLREFEHEWRRLDIHIQRDEEPIGAGNPAGY